jgi:hypothetical protein
LEHSLLVVAAKPEGLPSPGSKKWQEFCGYKFTTERLHDRRGEHEFFVTRHAQSWGA